MIYIISQKEDIVTDLVAEWLVYWRKQFKRFHTNEFVKSGIQLSNDSDELSEFVQPTKVWQRRGTMEVLPKEVLSNYPNRRGYVDYLIKEARIVTRYQEHRLKQDLNGNLIGSMNREEDNNKLTNLLTAKDVGLLIPNTLVTTSKDQLLDFFEKHTSIISKDLRAPVLIRTRHKTFMSKGVELVDKEKIEALGNEFAPIFVQQYIEKEYEIRAFVVCGKIYPMAIFSQNDEQTKVDFRNYNDRKPNRCVPVKLPEEINEKISLFMDKAGLNTGSIDIIRTIEGDYVFLEVNPMGQFHWVSQNCNYHIEREIAKYLSDEKN